MIECNKLLLCFAVIVVLCGCSSSYKKPDIAAPEEWNVEESKEVVAVVPAKPISKWWKQLNDETLNNLVEMALANNNNLKIAEARINEATALRGAALAKLFPSIDLTSSAMREGKQSSLGGSDGNDNKLQAGLSANWVIDLFGGSRAELKAKGAAMSGAEAEFQNTSLLLVSELASTYVEMRALQQRMDLTKKNLQIEEETLRATRIQHDAQAVSKLDVLRAEAQVKSTSAEIPSIEILLAASSNRLNVLVGANPGSINKKLQNVKGVPEFNEKIIMDKPVNIIATRPDIKAAEYKLIEAASLKDSAVSDLFPKISLSAFFGAGDSNLYGTSNPWSIGASALMPLLQFGKIEKRIKAADARSVAAMYEYKQSVLKALEEVENALISYDRESKRSALLDSASESYSEAARLARIKYEAGDANFLDLLIAEERLLDAQSSAIISQANATKAAINLYTALGVL